MVATTLFLRVARSNYLYQYRYVAVLFTSRGAAFVGEKQKILSLNACPRDTTDTLSLPEHRTRVLLLAECSRIGLSR